MHRIYIAFLILSLSFPAGMLSQENPLCEDKAVRIDILEKNDSTVFSVRFIPSVEHDTRIVFCPAGIKRSSPNDIKKRFPFEWTVKYNNIYLLASDGLIFEGMNQHGFSASLMFLSNSRLPEKDKEHIPIASSLAVNFFIDHFKCIDTALLAVWDIRIFDDIQLDCGWPFRIILHDSTGATAYIEYINGERQVYTPDAPAVIVGGPSYARLLTIKYLEDSIPTTKAESNFLQLSNSADLIGDSLEILRYEDIDAANSLLILKELLSGTILIQKGEAEYRYTISQTDFIPGEETSVNLE
jgi:penicillin V acylase-like amidase (Ntn superfamily)